MSKSRHSARLTRMGNIAVNYLDLLPVIFSEIKGISVTCNILLLKVNVGNQIHYGVKTLTDIYEPLDDEIKIYELVLKQNIGQICKHSVNTRYGIEQYESNTFSFVLFTNEIDTTIKTRERTNVRSGSTTKTRLNICGFVFLKEYIDSLYLSLICAKAGIGSQLLKLAEIFTEKNTSFITNLPYKNLLLTSLEDPLGFYIYKKYKLERGRGDCSLSSVSQHKVLKTNKTIDNQLRKHGYITNDMGLTYKISNVASTLPRKAINNMAIPNRSRRDKSRFLTKNTKLSGLHGVKVNHNGVKLSKNIHRRSF